MDKLFRSIKWEDRIYFGLRWLTLIGISILIVIIRDDVNVVVQQLITPITIGTVATLIFGFSLLNKSTYSASPYLALVADWITAGVFIRLIEDQPLLTVTVGILIVIPSALRWHLNLVIVEVIGVIASGALALISLYNSQWLQDNLIAYIPIITLIGLTGLVSAIWLYVYRNYAVVERRKVNQALDEKNNLIHALQKRAEAVSEMSATLNSTLRYERVLDNALSIGRLSIREDMKQRIVSVVLLYTYENEMEIVNSRGLALQDERRIVKNPKGIIGKALQSATPMIGGRGEEDPELKYFNSFKSTESILCIPLRAGFDNYGALIYGSDAPNAFGEEHIHSLKTIGTQATIALQNSVLYRNLLEERERFIELEEDARKELVRDLHDVPTQTISAVAMRLGVIPRMMERDSQDKIVEEVEMIREMALRATEEIRHVLFQLRPLILESKGLTAALMQLKEKMQMTYKQPVSIQVERGAERYLDVAQQGTLFYLIEEAVNNSRKYAQADVIRVTVQIEGDMIAVRVTDNGRGFDAKSVNENYEMRGSFGMVNMRERAELLDGILTLKSTPGKGTQVTVMIPVTIKTKSRRDTSDTHSSIPRTKLAMAAMEKTGDIVPQ